MELAVADILENTYRCRKCGCPKQTVKRLFDDEKKLELECAECRAIFREDIKTWSGRPARSRGQFDCEWCYQPNPNSRARGQHMRWCDRRPGTRVPKLRKQKQATEKMMVGIPTAEEQRLFIQDAADRLWQLVRFYRILADHYEKAAQELEAQKKEL